MILILVDFTKAFDTLDRTRLWKKMRAMGVPEEVVKMFEQAFGRVRGKMRGPNGEKSPLIDYLCAI